MPIYLPFVCSCRSGKIATCSSVVPEWADSESASHISFSKAKVTSRKWPVLKSTCWTYLMHKFYGRIMCYCGCVHELVLFCFLVFLHCHCEQLLATCALEGEMGLALALLVRSGTTVPRFAIVTLWPPFTCANLFLLRLYICLPDGVSLPDHVSLHLIIHCVYY